jgi:hypothetical protein
MSLASDTATLASQGFLVDFTTGQYRIVRRGVDCGARSRTAIWVPSTERQD